MVTIPIRENGEFDLEKQKEIAQQRIIASIQKCLSRGMPIEEIADLLGISLVEIQNIQ